MADLDQALLDRLPDARGDAVFSSDGDRIGKIEEVYDDEATGRPEWIGIGVGAFTTKRVLVPVAGARLEQGGRIVVPFAKDLVKHSPDIGAERIDPEIEARLRAYYGVEAASGTRP